MACHVLQAKLFAAKSLPLLQSLAADEVAHLQSMRDERVGEGLVKIVCNGESTGVCDHGLEALIVRRRVHGKQRAGRAAIDADAFAIDPGVVRGPISNST